MRKIGIGAVIVLGIGLLIWLNYAFFTGQFLGLPTEVNEALETNADATVAMLENDSWLVMTPNQDVSATGLIMFPEGQMDIRTYAPIGQAIAQSGYQVIFLSRRLEQEFNPDEERQRIKEVMIAYPEIEQWFVGGHTWGGQIAADFASEFPDEVGGVVLWAGRLNETTTLADSSLPVLMIYGSLDDENVGLLEAERPFLPPHTIWIKIEGGNRVQFGNYGPMAADVGATISNQEQQRQTVAAITEFLYIEN